MVKITFIFKRVTWSHSNVPEVATFDNLKWTYLYNRSFGSGVVENFENTNIQKFKCLEIAWGGGCLSFDLTKT